MTSGEVTAVVIVAIIVFGLMVENVANAVKKVKLAKHGCKETKDGMVTKL